MKTALYRLVVAAVAGVAVSGCKSDPTASNAGSPASLVMSFVSAKVRVDDSELVTAHVLDLTGAPVVASVAITACNPRVVTVVPTSAAPLAAQTNFFAKGDSFAVSCVIATSGALRDTMQVATFPDRIKVLGRDTILSGTTQKYTWQYLSKSGRDITPQVTGPTWSTDSAFRGSITAATADTGLLAGKDVGAVAVAGTGPGIPSTVKDSRTVLVVPAAFIGTSAPASAAPTDTVTLTAGAGNLPFDANTGVTINGGPTFVFSSSSTVLSAIMPPLGVAGSVTLLVKYGKPVALVEQPTLASSTVSFSDHYAPAADASGTASTLPNGQFYITLYGKCVNGGVTVGGSASPGDHCDRWFRLAGSAVKPDTVKVKLNWFGPTKQGGPDLDLYGLDTPTDFCGIDNNCAGATTNTPENTTFIIPTGATYWILVNLFNPVGNAAILAQVTVSGL